MPFVTRLTTESAGPVTSSCRRSFEASADFGITTEIHSRSRERSGHTSRINFRITPLKISSLADPNRCPPSTRNGPSSPSPTCAEPGTSLGKDSCVGAFQRDEDVAPWFPKPRNVRKRLARVAHAAPSEKVAPLTFADVSPLFDQTVCRSEQTGLAPIRALSEVVIRIADPAGRQLGLAIDPSIRLDVDLRGGNLW